MRVGDAKGCLPWNDATTFLSPPVSPVLRFHSLWRFLDSIVVVRSRGWTKGRGRLYGVSSRFLDIPTGAADNKGLVGCLPPRGPSWQEIHESSKCLVGCVDALPVLG